MHDLLARQLRRLGLDAGAPPDGARWSILLTRIARAYEEADQDRYLLERSLTISGNEMRQLYESVARSEAEQAALRRVATAVAAELPPAQVLPFIAGEIAHLLGAARGAVVRFEPGGVGRIVGVWGADDLADPPPDDFRLDASTAAGLVHLTGRPARVDDAMLTGPVGSLLLGIGVRSAVGAPIRTGDDVWGAIIAADGRSDAFRAGAEDAVARFAELAGMAVANAEARLQLANRASSDPLTGLANHRTFHEHLAIEVDRAMRDKRPLSLALFDIDLFKPINDRFGHQVGDRVLQEVAERIARCARSGDIVARVGGEEFAWLLPDCDGTGAWEAAERARRAVAGASIADVGTVTASAGVCELSQTDGAAGLYRLADGALYWAKSRGRDACVRYAPEVVHVLSAQEQADRLGRQQALTSVRVLARVVDAKDHSTLRHSERVASLAVTLATELGWAAERTAWLHEAGLVHDVGKIGIPDRILLKPGRLTEAEYEEIKRHAALGAHMLDDVLRPDQVAWVRAHHERYDGRGYPDGLAGDAIPDGGRILALADAWDVMTSARPYSEPMSPDAALAECRRHRGTQFAPEVVQALERLWERGALDPAADIPVAADAESREARVS